MNMTTQSDLKHKLVCLREALASKDVAERLKNMPNRVDILDDAISALSQPNEPHKPCEYCNDTGDVHRADGEWLGECDCMKVSQPNEPVEAYAYEIDIGDTKVLHHCNKDGIPAFNNLVKLTKLFSAPPNLEAKIAELEAGLAIAINANKAWVSIDKMKKTQIAELEEKLAFKQKVIDAHCKAQTAELTAKLDKAKEALEYYKDAISIDDSECECGRGTQVLDDGYKAREALEECK